LDLLPIFSLPAAEYLVIKMRHYHHFEKNPLVVENAHIAQPPVQASTFNSIPRRSRRRSC
jgi:hypothetical protein